MLKGFPIKYKKDVAIKMSLQKFYNFMKQYKLEPDVIVAEYECLHNKKVTKSQLNKVKIKNK